MSTPHPASRGSNWNGAMPRERRVALYLRAGLSCAACGWTARTLRRGARLSIDHLVAHSLGGDNGSANPHSCRFGDPGA